MFDHQLRLTHVRRDLTTELGFPAANSEIDVSVDSQDLTEAWRELLSRLPNDLYAGLKQAMENVFR